MTHHRERFERVYALTESVAAAELIRESEAGGGRPVPDPEGSGLWRPLRLNGSSGSFRRGEPDRVAKKMLGLCWQTARSSR